MIGYVHIPLQWFPKLCLVTQMLIMDLTHALELYPPPQPTRAAVDLLVTVGKHQEYLVTHGLLPPHDHPGSLDALKVR